ncbi:MAG: ribosome silencing factor [Planctomycetes bacterium]|nr:ribosome silencing factor [Planctomycetota bacterium]MCP4769971.1 ribosome silencing factor [Planctomycetota bacterium]MCP4859811.1 ribosome silencing factor [Planctomycetota bacterium]
MENNDSSKDARALAVRLAHEADLLKGENIRILDVGEFLFLTDYFVLVTTQSMRQTKSMADSLKMAAKELTGSKGVNEGTAHSNWMLCDFDDVIVHILTEEAREFYGMDDLWADAEEIGFDPAA